MAGTPSARVGAGDTALTASRPDHPPVQRSENRPKEKGARLEFCDALDSNQALFTLALSLREPQAGGGVVDVIVRPEVSFDRLMANAVAGDLFGRHVPIACIDDLLVMKRAANRSKDRLDIEALEKIRRGADPNA